MNRHALSAFLALALVFILSSITASAQQPRAVPPNDNIASAKAIKIGKNYSVPEIPAATNQVGEPVASCYFGMVIPRSVWFTFTLQSPAQIYLSNFNTVLISPGFHSFDTVMAVYEMTGGVLTERACNDNTPTSTAAAINFNADAGKTYYIATGMFSTGPYLPESTLKLNTRMIYTKIETPNYSFETPISSGDWKLTNGSNDQVTCSNVTYAPSQGLCTFRFTGTPGITTTLSHSVSMPTAFRPRKNAFLLYEIYYRVMDTAALGRTKIKMIITYSDGTPPSIHTDNLTGIPAMIFYNSRYLPLPFKSAKIASIKIAVKFGSPTGTLLVDRLSYYYAADVLTRTDELLLPVPPAAK